MIARPQMIFGSLMLAVAAFVAWVLWSLPNWSRPGLFFSVTVVPSFRDSAEAARVVSSFRMQALLHVVIGFGLVVGGAMLDRAVLLILGVLWLVAGPLVAVSIAHAKALPHAVAHSTVREASLAPRLSQLPGGWILQLSPFALLLVTAAYVAAHWNQIPDRFPVHWGLNGMPNGWSTRTTMGVYGPLYFGAGLVAMISLLSYAITHAARRPPASGGSDGKRDHPQRMALVLLGVELFVAAMLSFVALLPLMGSPGVTSMMITAAGIVIGVIFLSRWQSHGISNSAASVQPGDGTPDSCWKLGLFYFNPDDPALFVEKRVGIGYTINFARGAAWAILVLTVVLPLGLAALVIRNRP
ncbi:MAG TPA: DUF5808 domain-containing protein [Candidatus Acidoferrales bacterium]|nr:DUF5808 domain-containing protein [Candidatus Acidoferrales bacterium]